MVVSDQIASSRRISANRSLFYTSALRQKEKDRLLRTVEVRMTFSSASIQIESVHMILKRQFVKTTQSAFQQFATLIFSLRDH